MLQTTSQTLDVLFTSRILDLGAIIVTVTSFFVTTRNTIKVLKETLERLNGLLDHHQSLLQHHDTEIARINERCNLLNNAGRGCNVESRTVAPRTYPEPATTAGD